MPQNKDFTVRIEIIDECLRNRSKKWTLQMIIDTVNYKLEERYGKTIGKRTIQDDIKYLIEQKHAPIEKIKAGTATYFFYSDADYSIRNLLIKSEEIDYLNDAINILRQVNDFKILRDVDDIILKLQNTVETSYGSNEPIIHFEKHTISIGTHFIDDIYSAIKFKTPIRVTYQSFRAETSKVCIVHPYLLKEYRNRWFLIGRQGNNTSVTNYALDRIKEIKNSNEIFIENDLFNNDTYFNNLIGVTFPQGQNIEIIDLKISANQVPYIRTKPIHHTQQILREYKNGSLLIRLSLICNYELRSVLLGYGCDLQVLRPIFLRNEIINIFDQGLKLYK